MYTHTERVVTWQAPDGETVNVTLQQAQAMRRASYWPRNSSGEYCTVSRGQHRGRPTWTNAQLAAMIAAGPVDTFGDGLEDETITGWAHGRNVR